MSRPLAAIMNDLRLTTHRSDVLWAVCGRPTLKPREARRLAVANNINLRLRRKHTERGQFAQMRVHARHMAEIRRLKKQVVAVLRSIEASR